MPRSFSNQDYDVSKFLNTVQLINASEALQNRHLSSVNVFTLATVQNISVPVVGTLTESQFPPGGVAEFIAAGAAAHTITPDPGVTINGSSSALTFSATPYNTVITLIRSDENIWFAFQTVASASGGGGGSFSGCLMNFAGDITPTSTPTAYGNFTELYDVGSWHDAGAPTRLTVPSGVSYVRLSGQIIWQAIAGVAIMTWRKNGAAIYQGANSLKYPVSASDVNVVMLSSSPIAVVPGDYFELFLSSNAGNIPLFATNGSAFQSSVAIEKVG